MRKIISESFDTTFKIMKILGWYPPENPSTWYKVYGFVFYSLGTIIPILLSLINLFIERTYDGMQLVYITETGSFCSKLMPFLLNGHRLKKCMRYLDDAYFLPKDEHEEAIINSTMKVCKKLNSFYLVAITCSQLCFVIRALFYPGFMLPVQVWLPYEIKTNLVYYLTWSFLASGCGYNGLATSLLDPLIGGITYHVTAQFKVLKYRIQSAHKSETGMNQTYQNLVTCVKFHKALLEFLKEFEKCFSWTIFSQFFGTTLALCYCSIALTIVPLFSFDGITFIVFYVGIFWQVFFYCLFGSLLYYETDTLVTAIYMVPWYEYDVKTRKLLITMMEKAKYSHIVRSEKIIELTLDTFLKMFKSSYSLIAVLK